VGANEMANKGGGELWAHSRHELFRQGMLGDEKGEQVALGKKVAAKDVSMLAKKSNLKGARPGDAEKGKSRRGEGYLWRDRFNLKGSVASADEGRSEDRNKT